MPLPRTYVATPKDIEKQWFVVDAADVVLGRLASLVAMRVRGKHKPTYTPTWIAVTTSSSSMPKRSG